MKEETLAELRARVDDLQATCTRVENERREWKARADTAYRYLSLATKPPFFVREGFAKEVTHEDAQAIRDEIAKEAKIADQILQDAWTQTTVAVKNFVVEATDNPMLESGPALEFVSMWVARFRQVLGPNLPAEPQVGSIERWGHGPEELQETWTGSFRTREAALASAREDYGAEKPFYLQRGYLCSKSHMLSSVAERVLEDLRNAATDEAGEAGEAWPDVSDEGEKALDLAIRAWAYQHLDDPMFWAASGKPEKIEPAADVHA